MTIVGNTMNGDCLRILPKLRIGFVSSFRILLVAAREKIGRMFPLTAECPEMGMASFRQNAVPYRPTRLR
jgi:hypothetical protein